MISEHVVYYLGSKLVAAVLNLVAMAAFVRVAGPEVFGGYLVAMAWAIIIYSLSLQWLRFAYFAAYDKDSARELTATYLALLAIGTFANLLLAAAAIALGLFSPVAIAGEIVLVTGLAAYDAMHETARVRLEARRVALGVLTRAVLLLPLGLLALWTQGTALALAIAVGLSYWGAALVLLVGVSRFIGGSPSREQASRMWHFGRYLAPAFGLEGFGLQLDRLLLARHSGLADLGPYGAVSDFVRQLMVVVSEAISGAYMAIARDAAAAGREEEARIVLARAFRAYVALAAFGGAVIMRFDRIAIDLLFGATVGAAVEPYVGLIVAANLALVFRAYYFGSVLYLMKSSDQLFYSNAAHAAVAALTAVMLIPAYGAAGAAAALLLGHIAGCLVYVWSWRDHYVLRLPYGDAAVIITAAVLAFIATGFIARSVSEAAMVVLAGSVFLLTAAATAWRYDILSFNELSNKAVAAMMRRKGGGEP